MSSTVNVIEVTGANVYVGGSFTDAGGHPMGDFLAQWGCEVVIFGDGFESGDSSAWSTAIQ